HKETDRERRRGRAVEIGQKSRVRPDVWAGLVDGSENRAQKGGAKPQNLHDKPCRNGLMCGNHASGVFRTCWSALSRSRILLVNPAAHSKTAPRKINHLERSTWARNPPKMAYSCRV